MDLAIASTLFRTFRTCAHIQTHTQTVIKNEFFAITNAVNVFAFGGERLYESNTPSVLVGTARHRMLYMCILRVNHIKYYTP